MDCGNGTPGGDGVVSIKTLPPGTGGVGESAFGVESGCVKARRGGLTSSDTTCGTRCDKDGVSNVGGSCGTLLGGGECCDVGLPCGEAAARTISPSLSTCGLGLVGELVCGQINDEKPLTLKNVVDNNQTITLRLCLIVFLCHNKQLHNFFPKYNSWFIEGN